MVTKTNTSKETLKTLINITIYSYKVGFGDCFLLTFNYSDKDKRNMLIDFGSTQKPSDTPKNTRLKDLLVNVANDIKEKCKIPNGRSSKLHVLVASHRHKDHISGFSTKKSKNDTGLTSGEIIESLKPDLVLQPWTEDPQLNDLDIEKSFNKREVNQNIIEDNSKKFHAFTLRNMQKVASVIKSESERLGKSSQNTDLNKYNFVHTISPKMQQQLSFMSDNNLPNKSAVESLIRMGKRKIDGKMVGHYLKAKDKLPISEIIPGLDVDVLGPPDLEQHSNIKNQKSEHDEYWMLHSMLGDYWGMQAVTTELTKSFADQIEDNDDRLFNRAKVYQGYAPSHTRWFIRQIREARADQLLGLVRILDKAMNNTSLILLFEIAYKVGSEKKSKKLLFSGDAQIENWEYALSQPAFVELLSETDLYKVGHHGSRNATPKSLWKAFKKKSENVDDAERLITLMSTLSGKHGHSKATAVPRQTLVDELDKHSHYNSTENTDTPSTKNIQKNHLYDEITIDLV